MKNLIIYSLIMVLNGCAAVNQKTDDEIYQAAIDTVIRDSGKIKPRSFVYPIPSSGMVSDQIVISAGGGNLLTGLRKVLKLVHKKSNSFLIIMGNNPSLDYAMISNAVKDLDLTGTQLVYAGKSDKQTQIGQAIKQTGATFYFIDRHY